jgi:hypothetical protein
MKFLLKRLRRQNENGMALVTVMACTVVLIMLASAAVAYGVGSQQISHHDQNWGAALSAAEGGIDDFIYRLNQNANYWQYGPTNMPPDGNVAFKQYVPLAGGSSPGMYRYDIDASTIKTDGVIKIKSTGNVNGVKRTVYAQLRRRSFIDYLYFTDYETRDPALYTTAPPYNATDAQTRCALHYYGGLNNQRDVPGRTDFTGDDPSTDNWSGSNQIVCTDINFGSGDVINGKLHSNDAILICGTPTFNGKVTTSWNDPSHLNYRPNPTCTNNPKFANAGDPQVVPPLTTPPSNSAIKAETAAGIGGCLYTGPTRIVLNSTGTMTVKSPFSKQTNNACVTNGTGALPTNGVIYVQNVPSITTDPNYTSGCPYTVNGNKHPLGLPIANDKTTYNCTSGDVFIEGTLKGQLTVASENNITVTWNLTYANGTSGTDLLGLVANNYVGVYHPVSCTTAGSSSCDLNASFPNETARTSPFKNPTIDAAILSVQHSFIVQNYDVGAASDLGTLTILGAIGQRFRGAVGLIGSTGYVKNYNYDLRLGYLSPPKYLDPVASSWGEATWAEIPVAAGY